LKALIAVALIALGLAALAARAEAAPTIDYPSFSSTAGLSLNGEATQNGAALRLTPAEEGKSGTAFSDTEIQTTASFEAEFELLMHESNTEAGIGVADGMGFVLQPGSAQSVGESGGDLGFAGITPSADIEYDIFDDYFYNPPDPAVPYVSFMKDGNVLEHLAESETPLKFPLYGAPVWSWVDYEAATHLISVYAAPTDAKPATPLFTYTVNLAELLGSEYTFAGFTAGTGSGDAAQEVLNWQLTSSAQAKTEPVAAPPTTPGAHASSTSVTCNLIIATASDTCVATVTDVDVPSAITPTGQVSFSSASGGAFEGNVCNLVAIPNSPDAAGCSVQFLPPTAASLEPAITATYGGDAHHGGSVGHTYYPSAVELGKGIEIGLTGILSESGGIVTVPITSQFPGTTTGTLLSGPDDSGAGMASFSGLGGDTAEIAKAKKPSKKKTAKPVVFGTGSLTLSKPGKGTLTIKLNGKAKLAFKKVKGTAIKALLEVTVKTANGTLVKTEKLTVTIRPAKKPKKKSGKHGK
jgi:Legume lectin domain